MHIICQVAASSSAVNARIVASQAGGIDNFLLVHKYM